MAERWEPKERKSFPFELEEKGIDFEQRTIKGFFAVMGNFDGKDIIKKGAFKKTLEEQGDRVKVFWIHEFREPIGKPLALKEVPRSKLPPKLLERAPDATGGLYANLKISETRRGNEALVLARDGVLDEGSIGFDTVKEEWVKDEKYGEVRHIKELKLYDLSPVPIAMNPAAIITEVKSELEEKVEVTDDRIHVPVPGEEGKHKDHRIRYIDIDKDKGIQAKYCGECKKVISYVFLKEKTWTVAKAVAWVKEHHEKAIDKVAFLLDLEAADLEARIQRARIQRQEMELEAHIQRRFR